jgi:glycerol-1-phosphate dehydrogenase [NAD(P)+]
VINDLGKMLAFVTGRRAVTAGTAPSMDGYASNSSSMLCGGVKTTVYNICPEGILLDTDIMAAAPMRMLHAGLGDMLAKYVSVCEWRLSNLITGEYYCENIAGLVRRSVEKIMSEADRLSARGTAAINNIAEGLVMSGIAMSYAGTSRPASGLEHYFSHVWDMRAIKAGKRPDLHGIQVGVGTLLTFQLYDWLREVVPDRQRALEHMRSFDSAHWESEMRRIFGPTAGQIIEIENQHRKNDPEKHASRLDIIIDNWDKILEIINEELPRSDEITALASRLEMPCSPKDIGLNPDDVYDAFIGAREIRDKYLLCNLLWDLGLLYEFALRLRHCV